MAIQRRLATPTYLVAFALACIPPIDAIVQALPLRFHEARWRFGAFGLFCNSLILALGGVLIAFVAASIFEHRRVQRVLGVLSAIVALGLVVGFISFGLDALQIRSQVQPAAHLAFRVATIEAVAKSIFTALTLTLFTIAAFRGPRPKREQSRRDSLVMGTSGTAAPGLRPASTLETPAEAKIDE